MGWDETGCGVMRWGGMQWDGWDDVGWIAWDDMGSMGSMTWDKM